MVELTRFGAGAGLKSLKTTILAATAFGLLMAMPMAAHASQDRPRVEVTFVVDTTGSMADLIEGAKRKIWSIATTISDSNPDADIRMALVAYRDRGDQYVTKVFDLTADLQDLYGELVRFKAAGGGDGPESVNEALQDAVKGVKWTPGQDARKIIFLVGDAPPHMDYRNAPKYPEVIAEARKNNIIVNAVQAGFSNETRQIWQDIAERGDGRYIPIPQDGGEVVVIESPFDDDIIVLQGQLNETIIPYGSDQRQDQMRRKIEGYSSAPAPTQAENSAFYAKRAARKEVMTGEGDLAADLENGRNKLEDIKEAELPAILKDKSPEERKAYVDAQITKRRELQQHIADLV